LRQGRAKPEQNEHGTDGDDCTLPVGTQGSRHAPHRLRDDRDRDELEAVQESNSGRSFEQARPASEQHQRDGRRQRESQPRGDTSRQSGAKQADRESDLAARGAGQELAQAHEVCIRVLVEPAPLHDEFIAEVTEMSDGTAEAGQAELQEYEQDFQGAGCGHACRH
jgi:hypothetical protein